MPRFLHIILLLGFALADFNYNDYKYGEYTLVVLPRQVECVYMDVTLDDKTFEIAYQVVEGGELDISLYVYRPDHSLQESELRKMEGGMSVTVQQPGEYRVCFDNSYSMVSKKVVYFEIYPTDVDGDHDDSDEHPGTQKHAETATQKQQVSESGNQATEADIGGEKAPVLDDKDDDNTGPSDSSPESVTKQVAKGLVRVNKYLTFVVQTLNYYKNIEARDRSVGEANFERVNSFSIIEIVIIIVVAIIQVVIVRAMLDPKSRLRQMVNKLLAKH